MNTNEINLDRAVSDIDLSYCRAALYSALAIGFQPPTEESITRLLTDDSKASLTAVTEMLYPSGQPDLISLLNALPGIASNRLHKLASQYRSLFGHTAHGSIPPYETEYGNEALFQQPQELGDLMGFYKAFGLIVKRSTHERADHISCEFEFLMFLALKESYALEHDDRSMLLEVRKAQKLFLRDHLARFLPTFTTRLNRENSNGFYDIFGALALRFVLAECARLQIQAGPINLGLRPADDARVPMACGNGTACAAIPGACTPEDAE